MDTPILLSLVGFFSLFAIYKESTEHNDAFTLNKAKDGDSIRSSLRKLEKCLNYDQKTIKWRRTWIATLISIALIFGIFYRRLPSAKELVIYFCFIFVVFYITWQNYSNRTAKAAVRYGKKNIENIKIQLKQGFVFPIGKILNDTANYTSNLDEPKGERSS